MTRPTDTIDYAGMLARSIPTDLPLGENRDTFKDGARALQQAVDAADQGRRQNEDTLNDPFIYPDGRTVMVDRNVPVVQDEVDRLETVGMAFIRAAEAGYWDAAVPTAPRTEEGMTARADATMRLDGVVATNGNMGLTLNALAAREDSVGGLILADSGAWTRDYLTARGYDSARISQLLDGANEAARLSRSHGEAGSSATQEAARAYYAVKGFRETAPAFVRGARKRIDPRS